MNQSMNKVNPEAGTLKQMKSAIGQKIGNTTTRIAAFMFSIALLATPAGAVEVRAEAGGAAGAVHKDSIVEPVGPGKPKVRPVQIPQPSERAFRLADYEVTRNMILSLQEKPVSQSMMDFGGADREMDGRFRSETTVRPVFQADADDLVDLAFRAENIQAPAVTTLAELDVMMDERFRSENGL